MLSCVVLKRRLEVGTTEETLPSYLDEQYVEEERCGQTAKLAMLNLQRHITERYPVAYIVDCGVNHYKSIACCFGRRVLTALSHWSLRRPIAAALYLVLFGLIR